MFRAFGLFLAAAALIAGCADERSRKGQGVRTAPASLKPAAASNDVPAIFTRLMETAQADAWAERPVGDIAVRVGLYFAGAPYEAGLLDRGSVEELVVTLDTFDCVLLVETALAAAQAVRDESFSFHTFREHLQQLRYRDGLLDGYCSRLHYFTDWIRNNESKGIVRDITRELGGIRLEKRLSFMSEHRESYPRFATNDSLFGGIKEMERSLEGLEVYYIPQSRIAEAYSRIESGDIIATATNIDGLDVSHTGFAYRHDGGVGFLHASTSGGVKVSPDLQEYVQNNRIQIGIVVARPI